MEQVNGLTPRAPDKCGHSPALSGNLAPTADSASGGFFRQVPPFPVTPAVETLGVWATVHGLAFIATLKNAHYDKDWETID